MERKETIATSILYHRWFSAATVMKYFEGFIGITEERNQSYGDASADWKTPVCFVPLPLYLKIR